MKEFALMFTLGKRYSRDEIHDKLGGAKQIYLPFKGGQVLCGCFIKKPEYNPDAPEEVVIGRGPDVEKSAKMVSQQKNAIPIFVYKADKQWEYVGDYQCISYSTDPDLCRQRELKYPQRGEIVGVLQFERLPNI